MEESEKEERMKEELNQTANWQKRMERNTQKKGRKKEANSGEKETQNQMKVNKAERSEAGRKPGEKREQMEHWRNATSKKNRRR